jgi:hypothetical protein
VLFIEQLNMMLRLVGVPSKGWAHREAAVTLLNTLNGNHTSDKQLVFRGLNKFPEAEEFPLGELLAK